MHLNVFFVYLGLFYIYLGARLVQGSVLTSLSMWSQNLEIAEIRQVHRAINVPSRTGRKVSLRNDIIYGTYFPVALV